MEPQLDRLLPPGIGHHQDQAEQAHGDHDEQDLGADEELQDHQKSQSDPCDHRSAPLTNQKFVETGDDQRGHHAQA